MWLTAAALIAATTVAVVLAAVLPTRVLIVGLPAASPLIQVAATALTAVGDLAAALTIGWLLAAAWLVPARREGFLAVGGYRAARAAAASAGLWAATTIASIPVQLSDVLGLPLADTLTPRVLRAGIGLLDAQLGAVITAVCAAAIAVVAARAVRVSVCWWLLALALLAVVPRAVTGHAAQALNHDIAVDSMLFHLVGVSVWVGGLVAVIGLVRQRTDHLDVVLRRYSTVAGVAFTAVALSGVISGWLRLNAPAELWNTGYGLLLTAKTAALLLLGTAGYLHRRRILPAAAGSRRALLRLAGAEVALMAVTMGLAAALSRTAPPPAAAVEVSDTAAEIGFALDGPPTLLGILTEWRFDGVMGSAAIAAAVLYVVGVRRLHRRGDLWKRGRTIAWVGGCAVLLFATSSGLGRYAQAQFSYHMISHMLLAMIAPALMVLGGPVTLALRVLPAAGARQPPGAREMLLVVMHSRFLRVLTHPLVVLALFIGSFVALYFTGLFELMVSSHLGHLLMNIHFLLVGYLYYWLVIGIDPAPRRLPSMVKLAILLVPVPFHAFFGLAMMNSRQAVAADHYRAIGLPWITDLAADQRVGGAIAWAATEAPIVIVVYALLAQWARSDAREARRGDRNSAGRNDDELQAYNAMLAELARINPPSPGAPARNAGPGPEPGAHNPVTAHPVDDRK